MNERILRMPRLGETMEAPSISPLVTTNIRDSTCFMKTSTFGRSMVEDQQEISPDAAFTALYAARCKQAIIQ